MREDTPLTSPALRAHTHARTHNWFYSHLLQQGAWLLQCYIVSCTTVELKDWIKWSDPALPGGSETSDYSHTIPVLQRTPVWHSDMHILFSNTFPSCKTSPAPWYFHHGEEKMQISLQHTLHWSAAHLMCIKKVVYMRAMGKGRSYHPQMGFSLCDCLAFKIDASLFLFSFL